MVDNTTLQEIIDKDIPLLQSKLQSAITDNSPRVTVRLEFDNSRLADNVIRSLCGVFNIDEDHAWKENIGSKSVVVAYVKNDDMDAIRCLVDSMRSAYITGLASNDS